MSNILPKEAKQEIWKMYRARFTVVGSLVALLTAGLCALALLPSYLALHAAETEKSSTSTPKTIATEADRAAVASLQNTLEALSPLISTTTPTATVIQALSLRPAGITIDHITYSGGNPATIMLVGAAATRESINGYRQALSGDSHWKTITVPVGDLTGEPGARFSITLSGNF